MADLLRSELLTREGFLHGFSLRTGGVSPAPFDSLNLGRGLGDDAAVVAENVRLFQSALGADLLFEVSQVHGTALVVLDETSTVQPTRLLEADGLLTDRTGAAVGVRVADCVPVLLADRRSGAVAAVHAGWRGAVNHIVPRAIEEMNLRFRSEPKDLVAAIGPHIRLPSFEIGEEVAEAMQESAGEVFVVDRRRTKPHGDLTLLVQSHLRASGLIELDDVGGDTFTEPGRFFSYRRDGKATGRHLAAIAAQSPQ